MGFYSFVEVIDDSNKRPDRTVLCVLMEANGKEFADKHVKKCVLKTMKLAAENGVYVTDNLDELAQHINNTQKVNKPKNKVRK